MKLSYELKRSDLALAQARSCAYLRGKVKHSQLLDFFVNLVVWATVGFSVSVLLGSLKALGGARYDSAVYALWGLLVAAAVLALWHVYSRRRMANGAIDLSGPFPIPASFSVTPNGMETSSPIGLSTIPFESLAQVLELPAHVLVVLRSGAAMPIPRSAFVDVQQVASFCEELRKRQCSLTTH